MAGVMIIAEQRDGAFRKITYEAASVAKKLSAELGGEVTAVVLGGNGEEQAAALGKYGVSRVLYSDDDALSVYSPEGYASAAAELIKGEDPDLVILGASVQGKELAGRLAAKLDAGVAMDCTGLEVQGGKLVATRPIYASKVYAQVSIEGRPQLVSIRPNVFDVKEVGGEATVEKVSPSAGTVRSKVVEVLKEAEDKIELTEATIIVSGGRGMKDADNFAIIEELANILNAAVGASRSAVDAGWRPHSDQVGQTGKVVNPNLYIACGISGAIQHLAGMGSSKVIVAINKDPDAPIHAKADYSVVADLFDVVPALKTECQKISDS